MKSLKFKNKSNSASIVEAIRGFNSLCVSFSLPLFRRGLGGGFLGGFLLFFMSISTFAQFPVEWKKNFGGNSLDAFYSITPVSDGFVMAGQAANISTAGGDWTGVTGKGSYDAILVKYSNNGEVVWKKCFGSSGVEQFNSVIAVSDGFIAVGNSFIESDGDLEDFTNKGYYDALIVKFNSSGEVVWKNCLGGEGFDRFKAVMQVSDGFIAVGEAEGTSFGNGDFTDLTAKGMYDALIVKYDNSGNLVWKKNIGGIGDQWYLSATLVSDGFVAVGSASAESFGNGDFSGLTAKGDYDGIIVKHNLNGDIVWKKNFGCSNEDFFYSLMAVSDGIIAVGNSDITSDGDWSSANGKGGHDAIIVKYSNTGDLIWKKNFGGSFYDQYTSVNAVSDGFIAVGWSNLGTAGTAGDGDWEGYTAKGGDDAIIVKYSNSGEVISKYNFGGNDQDQWFGVIPVSDGFISVGRSYQSMGNGDWEGHTSHGWYDATIVKFSTGTVEFVPVTNITGVPTETTAFMPLPLTGTVTPSNATNQTIIWSVASTNGTGASIVGNVFTATVSGTASVRAKITNGLAVGSDYEQLFNIVVSALTHTITASVSGTGGYITPSGAVSVNHGASQTFTITPDEGYHIASILVDGEEMFAESGKQKAEGRKAEKPSGLSFSPAGGGRGWTSHSINQSINQSINSSVQLCAPLNLCAENKDANFIYSFTNVTADHTIVTSFVLNTYTVATNINPAGAGTTTGENTYTHGESATVEALPSSEDFEFLYWTFPDGQTDENPYTFIVTSDITLTANFKQFGKVLVSVVINPEGAGSYEGAGQYSEGDEVELSATPFEAYNFLNWMVNDLIVEESPVYKFIASEDVIVFANFAKKLYTITASVDGGNGDINPKGDIIVNHGDNQTFIIYPDVNYRISSVFVDGVENPTAVTTGIYTFTNIVSNHNIVVAFEENGGIENQLGIRNYELVVYPNPTSGELFVEVAGQARNDGVIEIFDIFGNSFSPAGGGRGWISTSGGGQGEESFEIKADISHLPSGIYILKINNQSIKVVKK